jgi:alkylhydroperoxidase family enzyme
MAVEEVAKVISNWREADLDDQEKTMLAFTESLP